MPNWKKIITSGSDATLNSLIVTSGITITGSLTTTGSNTLIGNTSLTGSVNISGSTVQVGNNTLLGDTLLTGSIIISASFPVGSYSSSVNIYGDTTMTGYLKFNPQSTNIDTTVSASYIFVSGSTSDLYFSQNSRGIVNTTRLRWLEGNLYTGLLHGGLIVTQSSTTYKVTSGSGLFVSMNTSLAEDPYPTATLIEWPDLVANISPLSASFDQSFVAVQNIGGTAAIYVQGTPYDDGAFNTLIPIGNVIHQNRSSINATATYPSVAYAYKQRSSDFIRAFGALKLSGLNTIVSGSSTGSLQITSGTAYSEGRNYVTDPNNPSYVNETGQPVSKIFRYYQSGSNGWKYETNGGAGFESINPTQYSLNGTLTTVPTNDFSIQRVFYFPGGATKGIYVYYGNKTYPNIEEAIAAIPYDSFIEAPNTAAGAIFSAYLLVRHNADFTVPASYNIQQAGLFRNVGGSGGGGSAVTQTLNGLSDVNIAGPTNGQPLVYNGTTLKWENNSILTASLNGNATTATTASYVLQSVSSSFASTASYINTLNQDLTLNGNLTLNGTASISYLNVTYESASIIYSSGSNQFGDTTNDIQTLIGTVIVSGSQQITGSLNVTQGITGSLQGTASFANISSNIQGGTTNYIPIWDTPTSLQNSILFQSASNIGVGTTSPSEKLEVNGNALIKTTFIGTIAAFGDNYASFSHTSRAGTNDFTLLSENNGATYLNASIGQDIKFRIGNIDKVILDSNDNFGIGTLTPNAKLDVNGNAIITGSLTVTSGITGSLFGTASWAENALTASYINPLTQNVQVTGSINLSGSLKLNGSFSSKTTRITSAAYTASINDYRIGVKYTDTGAVSIQLPLISSTGEIEYKFKDEDGNAGINAITLIASGSDLIDNSSTIVLQRNYIAVGIYNDGISNWYIE